MSDKIPVPSASFRTTITDKVTVGDTEIKIDATTDDSGNDLDGEVIGFVIDKGKSTEDFILGTVDAGNSQLTGVVSLNVRTLAQTSGAGQDHRKKATIEITSFPYLSHVVRRLNGDEDLDASSIPQYDAAPSFSSASNQLCTVKFAEDQANAGAANASTVQKGIVEIATTAETDAGTAQGSTGADLAVNPAQLAASIYSTRLPSAGQKTLLDGITASYAEINALDGYTGDVNDLNEMSDFFQNTDATGTEVESLTDGSGIGSTLHYHLIKFGKATRSMSTASGNQTIAHGLGVTPRYIEIQGILSTAAAANWFSHSHGMYDGTTTISISGCTSDSGTNHTETTSSTTYILQFFEVTSGNNQSCTVTMDATNITLAWTKTGSVGTGEANFIWKAYA